MNNLGAVKTYKPLGYTPRIRGFPSLHIIFDFEKGENWEMGSEIEGTFTFPI